MLVEDIKLATDIAMAIGTWFIAIPTFGLFIGVFAEIRKFREEQKKSERDQRYQFYTQIDAIYFDIQRQIIKHPHLSAPEGAKSAMEARQYDAFAFMVWNFIETIYDYVHVGETEKDMQKKKDEFLDETWGVIMSYEGNLHKAWFLEERNVKKFKPRFREVALKEIIRES